MAIRKHRLAVVPVFSEQIVILHVVHEPLKTHITSSESASSPRRRARICITFSIFLAIEEGTNSRPRARSSRGNRATTALKLKQNTQYVGSTSDRTRGTDREGVLETANLSKHENLWKGKVIDQAQEVDSRGRTGLQDPVRGNQRNLHR